jgi:ENTS family enterobactin (siderophore) exporter
MTTVRSTTGVAGPRKLATWCAALVGVALLALVGWTFSRLAHGATWQPWDGDYTDLGRLSSWLVGSISEPQFYAVAPAGALLLVGGLVGHVAHRWSWRWQGFVQACGTGLWPWAAGSALFSLLLGNLAWGWTAAAGDWQPLFVPLVSVAPAIVVLYGPGWRVALTAAVLGALLTPPASILAVTYVCAPLDLPPVVGATTGMWLGAIVAFWLCGRLNWMPAAGAWREQSRDEPQRTSSLLWVPRRALGDFSEAQFFGNEWASAALILGAVVTNLISPASTAYGSGLFSAVLASQVLTALTGVIIWRRKWQRHGFYPTFVPVVSVAPATVLAFGGTFQSIVVGALAGALIAPPVAAAISARLPKTFHPFVGNVASMSICTALIVPPLGLLPGFTS